MSRQTTRHPTRAALLDSQRRVLERIASGAPLREIVETLVRLIEEQARGMRCAVLLADPVEQRLGFIAAPSIPEDYKAGIAPFLRIAPGMGACGTAAYLRQPVYTRDTATDARWEKCRHVALRNGLRAIWSTPILSDDNSVLGTFAMYYGEPRLPSPEHIQLIDMATQMARVAIEAKRGDEARRQSEFELAEAQRVARLGSWSYDLATNTVRWSEELCRIFDVENTAFGSYETFVSRVYFDDQPRVRRANAEARTSGAPFELEYRITTRSGQPKHIREVGYAKRDSAGAVSGLFGTAQDITERKRAENALLADAVQLQALSRRLVELQESQHRQIALELHDRVGQNLTVLGINLGILRTAMEPHASLELRSRLGDCAALVESTALAIGDVMAELRPPMLDDYGLFAALDWYAKQFEVRTGIGVTVRCERPDDRLDAQAEIAIFRIAQEALNNVLKHARASRVEIVLARSAGQCVMSVTDDGVGLRLPDERVARSRPGLGMVTMRERAQALGGRVDAQALPQRGTRLSVRVPG